MTSVTFACVSFFVFFYVIEALTCFVDQVGKCDAIVPHEEHRDGKWAVSGTSNRGQRGGHTSYQSG